ncbi:MAG: hypothetical protein ACREXT_13305 [Gammaproteobacteria bacterium]
MTLRKLMFTGALVVIGMQAHAASTGKATIDIGSLLVSGTGFTFGDIPATFVDNAANATDLTTTDSESVVFGGALAMVNADTWATGSLIGTSLESEVSASTFSALASSRYYQAFTITYDTDFGGMITTTVDYTMAGSDGFAPNPSAPFADVFANVQLDVWAFDAVPSVSLFNDGDVRVGLAFFGAPLADAGTLTAEILLPDLPAGTVLVFATESSIQINAVGVAPVPVPAAFALFASALGGMGFLRRRV